MEEEKNIPVKTENEGKDTVVRASAFPVPIPEYILEASKAVYTIDTIIQKILDSEKQYDLSKIVSAYELAEKYHHDQRRESGEPYISHPLAVAHILLDLGMDTDTICSALLHDVVEDTACTLEELQKRFGADVAMLVNGVTKLGKVEIFTKEEQKAENIRKILLAMSEDIRVIIIKLADRLHNMRTLNFCREEKRRTIAHETMNIYAPIAHRLGIRSIKEEFEDLAFFYLDPYAYQDIEEQMAMRKESREALVESIKARISDRLSKEFDPLPTIEGRVKSNYGIYKKVYRDGKEIDQIYDRYAVRIIVNTVTECYNVLGIIHDMYKPIPNRFKDYISTPKANMYQSLHTTVIGRVGIPFEVQIRTWDMHKTAEYGIAAHWKYKEGIKSNSRDDNRLAWIRQIIESQQESNDVEEIVRAIKNDLAPDDVFAFTPKGDMITLPAGSTVIDFAYAIHTQVGHKMCGAKADKKMVSYDYQIKTGEIIEILTTNVEGHGPSRSWLNIAKTNEAKSKIRSWFKKERREENIFEGRNALEREFRRNMIRVPEEELDDFLRLDMKRHNCETLEDFFAAIGYGGVQLSKLMQRLKAEYSKKYGEKAPEQEPVGDIKPKNAKSSSGVIVDGINDCVIKFAQCCNPLPGDDIVGFITRGHGISVHKTDCINYRSQRENPDNAARWVKVSWEKNSSKTQNTYFKATLDIVAVDRIGLLADVSTTLASINVFIYESSSRELKNGNALLSVTVSVAGMEQLNSVISKLQKIKNVISVERSGK
ncbi:MAG: bifunctional (p)ppGpp synthetase/guanosine-3',5'-bis(diphosphate) 3'-pyrophosphohydrolase [Ruminococcus sp.]|nr:bifunctional (p)ppGpp synthetase/guanosine-3',5'-bis(diphosphate) 3'-pyrophosphohydrolase [Ruminococcus sp.]